MAFVDYCFSFFSFKLLNGRSLNWKFKSNRQLSVTLFNMSTVIFSQHSFIFRRVGRRNKFSKLFLGFSEVSYTRCSVRFCNFSTLFFITSYCGIVHNFSTGFRHVFNNFFGDRTIEGFDGRIGSRGRTPLFRSVLTDWTIGISPRKGTSFCSAKARAPPWPKM